MLRDWCHVCEDFGDDTKLVRIVEVGSGPGGMLYACPPCRTEHNLTPLVDDDPAEQPVQPAWKAGLPAARPSPSGPPAALPRSPAPITRNPWTGRATGAGP